MDQFKLMARVRRLFQHELLGSDWSAPRAEHDGTVTLAGPGRHLLVFEVETDLRPGYAERIRIRGSFGSMAVPEGVRDDPSIYVATGQSDRQWAKHIRVRLLGGGSRGKNYTAALTAITALHERSSARSTATKPEPPKTKTRYPDPASQPAECIVRVQKPEELIIGIPAMIGFVPHRSLVVLILRYVPGHKDRTLVDAVLRLDLDQDDERIPLRAETVVSCMTQISATPDAVAGVLAVVVDDRATKPAPKPGDDSDQYRTQRSTSLVDELDRLLTDQDIPLAGAWMVRAIEPQQSWWSILGTEQRGTLPDPATSALTLAHVLDGRPILGSRADWVAMVTEDVELQQQVAALIDSAVAIGRDRHVNAARCADFHTYSRQTLEYVLSQLGNVEAGHHLTVLELAELAVALRDRTVRDAMLAVAAGAHATAAETLFSSLARACSGRERADAAALLAYSAYTRGSGPLTGIALEAALQADAEHPLAQLLQHSRALGVRPETIRRLARSGYEGAARLGIDLHDSTPCGPDRTADRNGRIHPRMSAKR
ncbi:DUF4192 domain-containing protein [Nocardia sp. NPDC057030]|uniref:DUF4192 domain-containing protein n=1 Tax=unclassified Nocardia TaxID=2637762 RepID=UPI0036253DE0